MRHAMQLLVGLDLGTSSFKGVVTDTDGRTLASARRDRSYVRPAPVRVEETHDHFRASLFSLLRELTSKVAGQGEIVSLACGAANGDTGFLDADAEPIGNIRSWMDERAVGEIDLLLPGLDPVDIYRIVGWPWDARFPFAQTAWTRKHDPAVFSRVVRVATDVDYVCWLLSGRWGIDPSSAASLYFIDQSKQAWRTGYLESAGLPASALSPIVPNGYPIGPVGTAAASSTGLPQTCMVRPGAFDHACVARGAGILEEGDFLLSCGTSWVGILPLSDRAKAIADGLLIDQYLHPEGPYLGLLDMGTIGGDIDCKRRESGLFEASDPHAFFESSASGEAPLSGGVARTLMEDAAFTARRGMRFLQERGYPIHRVIIAGGPSGSPTWTRIVASVLDRELVLSSGQYTGAIGAAIIAGVAEGFFGNAAEASGLYAHGAGKISPDPVWTGIYSAVSI